MWDGISRSVRQKTSTLCGFHLYSCLAAAQLQETHRFWKTETSSSYNQAFSVCTKSSTRRQQNVSLSTTNSVQEKEITTLNKTIFSKK
jgi:hypothetical protein